MGTPPSSKSGLHKCCHHVRRIRIRGQHGLMNRGFTPDHENSRTSILSESISYGYFQGKFANSNSGTFMIGICQGGDGGPPCSPGGRTGVRSKQRCRHRLAGTDGPGAGRCPPPPHGHPHRPPLRLRPVHRTTRREARPPSLPRQMGPEAEDRRFRAGIQPRMSTAGMSTRPGSDARPPHSTPRTAPHQARSPKPQISCHLATVPDSTRYVPSASAPLV